MDWKIRELKNELVTLRPLEDNDFEKLYQTASDPLIWEMHPQKDRYKEEVFQKFFDGALEHPFSFIIINTATNEVIGSSRYYDYRPDLNQIAIGYTFLSRNFWGGKYNKTIKKLMLDFAFEKVETILFHVGTENFRSQNAVEKLGASKRRIIDFDHYGNKLAHFEYELSKYDWHEKQQIIA